jgi:uncharacterized Fe-S radical SAM superfamily protein PflX
MVATAAYQQKKKIVDLKQNLSEMHLKSCSQCKVHCELKRKSHEHGETERERESDLHLLKPTWRMRV